MQRLVVLNVLKKAFSVNDDLINLKRVRLMLLIPLPCGVVIVMFNGKIQGQQRLQVVVITCGEVDAFEHLKIVTTELNPIVAIQPTTLAE